MIVWKIITGPIDSGKTTFAEMYLSKCTDVEGILCQKDHGKRFLRLIGDSQVYRLDADIIVSTKVDQITLKVGRYSFDRAVFQLAKAHLSDLIHKEFNSLLIDEIGKLELAEDGYEPQLSSLLSQLAIRPKVYEVVVVVRDYLLNDYLVKYGVEKYEVLK